MIKSVQHNPMNIICPKLKDVWVHSEESRRIKLIHDTGVVWPDDMISVGMRSPESHHNAVELMALYFKREFQYDFMQYSARDVESDEERMAFLWQYPHLDEDFFYPAGATCFRYREYGSGNVWAMQWAWIHPYLRRKGMMTAAWPVFCAMFKRFDVEPPLSRAMSGFLQSKRREDMTGERPLYC